MFWETLFFCCEESRVLYRSFSGVFTLVKHHMWVCGNISLFCVKTTTLAYSILDNVYTITYIFYNTGRVYNQPRVYV